MKKYIALVIFLLLVFTNCNRKRPNLVLYNSYFRFWADNVEETDLTVENGGFLFYSKKEKDFNLNESLIGGRYIDGFRDSVWAYDYGKDSVKYIIWGYYKDKYLPIETNVFSKADSIIYGDNYSVLKFNTGHEKIKLTISLNTEILKHLQKDNYIQLLKEGFKQINSEIISTKKIVIKKSNFKAFKISVKKMDKPQVSYLYHAYVFLPNDTTFDFTIQTEVENSFYAKVLFDAVISNTYVNRHRVHNPWEMVQDGE